MSRPARRLFDLEIDEVSAVDRPANQHGLISIAKALGDTPEEGDVTTIYSEAGTPIDEDELVHGQTVYAENGEEFVFLEDGQPLPEGIELDDDPDDDADGDADGDEPDDDQQVDKGWLADAAKKAGARVRGSDVARGLKSGVGGWKEPGLNRAGKTAATVGRHPKVAAGAATAAVGTAAGGATMLKDSEPTQKSLGTSVLEALSKAVTDADRDAIIAKAMDEVQVYKAQADEMAQALEEERDIRITEAFIAKAAEYNLPVAPERFGPILKSIAEVLDDEDLEVLDELLSSVGQVLYEERGFTGAASNSGVLDEVYGLSAELVGKSAGQISLETATVAMFEHNPAAYDEYLAEQNGR